MSAKTVKFQKIKLRNFLSYGDDPIEVEFQNGITFITGYNADDDSNNGVGKTTLVVESLSFLLFGETYRNIEQKLIPTKTTKEPCIVEGWLKINDDDVYIVRSLRPKKVRLVINNEEDENKLSIPETNKKIIELLGISKNMFVNTVVMTNKDSMSFLNQKKDFKTKFIEGMMNLEFFDVLWKAASENFKISKNEKALKQKTVDMTASTLELDEEFSKKFEKEKKVKIERIENEIDELKTDSDIKDYTSAIEQFEQSIEKGQENSEKIRQQKSVVVERLAKFKGQLTNVNSDLSSIKENEVNCPTCNRPFENIEDNRDHCAKRRAQLNSKKKNINDNISKCNSIKTDIEKKLKTVQDAISISQAKIKECKNLQKLFDEREDKINLLVAKKETTEAEENPFKYKYKINKENLDREQKALEEVTKENSIDEITRECLSPTGVKAILIKRVLGYLNNRINFYLKRLNSPFKFEFDEFFKESFTSRDGQPLSYGSLSGGEAKRVDFALLFAFRDIRKIQSGVHINITVMDELFDSALSEDGMQKIMDLLREKSNECYIIITHRPQNIEVFDCNSIELIKENSVTRLK